MTTLPWVLRAARWVAGAAESQLLTQTAWDDLGTILVVEHAPGNTGDIPTDAGAKIGAGGHGAVIVTTPQDLALARDDLKGIEMFNRWNIPVAWRMWENHGDPHLLASVAMPSTCLHLVRAWP